ncbi:hypothetical protein [Anaerosporobacter sp.]|uniref:hypothetical protein n=1 Tax=Anaerosporobacter sp. TaxID=1872529 RepID=UPI00286F0555|nr:hypothetical protein [Anaerosporobacter sp.]
MICKICGRHIENENANFCENCGESLRAYNGFDYQESVNPIPVAPVEPTKEPSKEISFKTFLGIMLLQIIPVCGWFIYVVVLFTWAFGNKQSQTHKNFAKASLIMTLLSLLAALYLLPSLLQAM